MSRNLRSSADIDRGCKQINKDVYRHMWGPSEFDEARYSTVKYYQSLVPNSRLVLIENAVHMTMQDNPQKDIQAIC